MILGVVINIDCVSRGFQAVHICDAMFNIVSVQFWGSIAKFAVESIVKVGNVLMFSNLQWRNSSSQGNFFQSEDARCLPTIPCLYVTEYTLVSTDAKEPDHSKMLKDLALEAEKVPEFFTQAQTRLGQLTKTKPKNFVSLKTIF